MPNTFLRPYLNFKPISLVVRSKKVLPWEDTIYRVPRSLQKLGDDSHLLCPQQGEVLEKKISRLSKIEEDELKGGEDWDEGD